MAVLRMTPNARCVASSSTRLAGRLSRINRNQSGHECAPSVRRSPAAPYAFIMQWRYDLRMGDITEDLDRAGHSAAPRYNILAVEKATGLSARTLRSWERRYGVPAPHRDAHGRRLYSDRDIATVRWLMERVSQGVAVSRAAAMLSEPAEKGERPSPPLETLQLRLLQAIDWMDEEEVRRVLAQALQTAPVETVALELLQPVLYRVGDLWEAGRLSVGSEHFGTHLLRTALADFFEREPDPWRSQHIIVGCPPNELHDVGALVFALFLRRAGFRVTYLGANLEAESLMGDLRRIRPTALCMSATTADTAAALGALYGALTGTFPGVLAYGGRAFNAGPDVGATIPGVFLGADLRAAVDTLAAPA